MKKITLLLVSTLLTLQANSFSTQDQARVINSKPIYKIITKSIPIQECWDEQVPVQRYRNSYSNSQNPLGLIIGGIAGGVIGHQVGRGRGKDLATVGGALIGTMVGHNLSRRNQQRDSYTTYETQKRCSTSYQTSKQRKIVAYKNIAKYKGKKIIKISDKRLRYIPISIRTNY